MSSKIIIIIYYYLLHATYVEKIIEIKRKNINIRFDEFCQVDIY